MDSSSPSPKKNVTLKRSRLVSLEPITMNDWIVQSSVLNNKTICLVLFDVVALRCYVRYFQDEVECHLFLMDVVQGERDVSEDDEQ
jgi:hypothetical protein